MVVVGGEHFQSRSNLSGRLLGCLYSGGAASWYSIAGPSQGARAAHCMVCLPSGLYILAGRDQRRVLGNICKLVIKENKKEK